MAKAQSKSKAYWDMDIDELRDATKEFDAPVESRRTKPLSAADRRKFERAKRAKAYSVHVHPGKKRRVTISVDERLLERCEALAKSSHLTRDQVIERSLVATLVLTSSLPKAG